MDPVTGILAAKAFQGVTSMLRSATEENPAPETTEKAEGSSDFDGLLKSLITPNGANQTNEEELFAALVQERIVALKGEEAGSKYNDLLSQLKDKHRREDGYTPVEKAAKGALKGIVEMGELSQEEADSIYSQAFAAAQLDDNHEALYDGRGGPSDVTVALATMDRALEAARAMIARFEAGEATPEERPLDGSEDGSGAGGSSSVTPEGNEVDGADGFLFKPESDHEGKLVVLTPRALAHEIASLILRDENGEEVERGKSSGYGNGDREHFRFDKPGSAYPKNLTVEVTLKDGTVKEYSIPDPSQRYD